MAEIEVLIDYEDRDLIRYKWHIGVKGYVRRRRRNKEYPGSSQILLHRVILERKLGRPIRENMQTHHINFDKLDNRRDNLEEVTSSENMQSNFVFNEYWGFRKTHNLLKYGTIK